MHTSARFRRRLVTAAALILFPVAAGAQSLAVVRVVTANALAFSRPETRSPAVTTVPLNAELEVLDTQDEWFWVMLARDAQGTRRGGWLHATDVQVVKAGTSIRENRAPGPPAKPSKRDVKRLQKAERELEAARRQYEKLVQSPTTDSAGAGTTDSAEPANP
jgi:hypothetical protein